MTDRIKLESILSELLEIDEKELKEKLKPFKDKLIEVLSEYKTFVIPGVGEIYPVLLEPGVFLDTHLNKEKKVGYRISPRIKLQARFKNSVKQQRLKNFNFY